MQLRRARRYLDPLRAKVTITLRPPASEPTPALCSHRRVAPWGAPSALGRGLFAADAVGPRSAADELDGKLIKIRENVVSLGVMSPPPRWPRSRRVAELRPPPVAANRVRHSMMASWLQVLAGKRLDDRDIQHLLRRSAGHGRALASVENLRLRFTVASNAKASLM